MILPTLVCVLPVLLWLRHRERARLSADLAMVYVRSRP